MQTKSVHPIAGYPEEARIAYVSLLGELCYIDHQFDDSERKIFEDQLENLEISDAGRAKVYAAIFDLGDSCRDSILEDIKNLNSSDLRYTLVADLFIMALANDFISAEEQDYIFKIGRELDISEEKINTIKAVQFSLWQIKNTPDQSENITNLAKECAASLAGAGVPIAAIAASGSVFGLGAAGITSGLAALGALVGGGMLAGTVLVVPAIAAGSVWGVKKLADLMLPTEK